MVVGEVVHPTEDLQIQSVSLMNPSGIRVVGDASYYPVADGASPVGAMRLEDLENDPTSAWASREPATGANLDKGVDYTVLLVLESDETGAKADAVQVQYRTRNGQDHVSESTTSIQFLADCQ